MKLLQLKKLIRKAHSELENEALLSNADITSQAYSDAKDKLKNDLLKKHGITPEELLQYEQGIRDKNRAKTQAKEDALKQTLQDLEERITSKIPAIPEIPTTEVIGALIDEAIAKIPPPTTQIINKIEKVVEKPFITHEREVIKEVDPTVLDETKKDIQALQETVADTYYAIPELPDYTPKFEELENHVKLINSNIFNMPDFRKLAMGLQGQIDALNSGEAGELTKSQADTYYYPLSTNPAGYLTDAPSDGNTYGRKNGAWSVAGGGGGMVYPGAGIALSTGSAWDTSITNNSANWNTAYSWGNHASAGYFVGTSSTIRGLFSAGTGIGYNNTTGVITSSITQYTDAMAVSAVGTPWTGLGYLTDSTLSIVSDSPLSGAGTSASHLVITPDATHRWLTDTLTSTWNGKQDAITTGTTSQYFRGDLSLATFPTIPSVGTWGALNYPTWSSGTPFVKMTAAGTFALDTNTYLTSLSGAVLTDQTSGQTIGDTTHRLTKLWATDITVTNVIAGSVTGNAGTVSNGIYTTSQVTALAAVTSAGDKGKYLYNDPTTGVLSWATVAGGGASVALDNLASVAINASLIPGAAGTLDLGSTTYPFRALYISDSSTTYYTKFLGGSQSANLTYTLPTAYPVSVSQLLQSTTGGVLSWVTAGTVTSVGVSSTNSTLTIGSSPVTTSGTITADINLGNANSWTALQTFTKLSHTVTAMSAQAIDGTTADIFTRTLAATETFTQSGFTAGRIFQVEVTQGSGTTYDIVWFAGITWITVGGTMPAMTHTSNGISTYIFRCTGTNTFLGWQTGTQ